jgi:ABC-type transporter Mla subunit MlaD
MMLSGAKTNQVFNQVFEYLAEWVDNASVQINDISNRVESLDDIGQIKLMLTDIKEKAEDNSENVELIDSLGKVFDKQIKRISALETKLDKLIVETTIKDNKVDIKPMESTLNKFLVAIDEKMSAQQDKIEALEEKLASVLSILDEKDTEQLTKKVGSLDKQITKLTKSVEKIASNVVEK